jgi:hypothetical protein
LRSLVKLTEGWTSVTDAWWITFPNTHAIILPFQSILENFRFKIRKITVDAAIWALSLAILLLSI